MINDWIFYSYFRTSWNIEAFSLCMFLLLPNLREVPHGMKGPGPGFVMRPVYLRSQFRNNTNTVSTLDLLTHLLQVRYRFFVHGTWASHITGRSRPLGEVGLSPRQYTEWNVVGRACSTGGPSPSRGCCLKCTVLPVQGGVLTYSTEC